MMSLKIRKYKKRDEIGFFNLDRELEEHSFNRRSKSNYIWKFNGKNPFGKSISYFATNKKKIVAHFGLIPLGWYVKNKYVTASCSIAMMIKPEWQNKGLIKFVGDKVFEEAEKRKIKLVYGYPNLRAHNLHIKFWNYQNIIKQYTYLLPSKKKKNWISSFKVIRIKKFTKKHDLFWNKFRKNYSAILDRKSSFLNWRYLARPDKNYLCYQVYDKNKEYQGYFVLKTYNDKDIKKIHIVDLFFKESKKNYCDKIIQTILCKISQKKFKDREISFWLNGDQNFIYSFKKLGFIKNDYRNMVIKGIDKNLFKINKNYLKNLYFTMGDTLEIY